LAWPTLLIAPALQRFSAAVFRHVRNPLLSGGAKLKWIMRFLGCLSVLFALLCPRGTHAEQMRPLPVAELTERSELVLHGTVASKECGLDPSGRIVTRIQLSVEDVWKGALKTNSFTIVHGGGKVGNLRAQVSGQVEYQTGEEVVAFLVLNQRGEGVTLGLAQGKFHVWKDKATGEKFAHNLFHGRSESSDSAAGPASPQATQAKPRLRFNDLASEVKGGTR
jgi:hypothetical protein